MMNTGRKKPYLFKIFVFWTSYSIPRCTASWRILARGEGQLGEVPVWRSTGLELISKLTLSLTGTPQTGTSPNWHFLQFCYAIENLSPQSAGSPYTYMPGQRYFEQSPKVMRNKK